MSERPDPLDRLDGFRSVPAPDQWDDIVARAREPEQAELRAVGDAGRRSRWMLAAAAATVLVIGVGVLIVAGGDDDGGIAPATLPSTVPVSPPPSTIAPTSVAPPTTDAVPPTTEPVPPTTEVIATAPALVSSCPGAEITGDDTISGGGGFDTFGRLGDEPSLVVTMPQAMEGDLLQTGSIARDIQRIPGGQVILVQTDEVDPGWQLVAVDDDGSIRWRRCGSGLALDLLAGGDGAALDLSASTAGDAVHVRDSDVLGTWTAWRSFDVVSGEDLDPLAVDPTASRVDGEGDVVLFEQPSGMRLVDLAAGTVADVPLADIDGEFTYYTLERPAGGESLPPVVVAREEPGGPALSVFVDGDWRTDRETLMANVELTVVENSADFGDAELGNGVWARDPLGATAWFRPIVNGIRGEGWATGVIGDVVLTNECRADDPNQSYGCGDPWHIALDLLSGDLLWEAPGFVAASASGDGVALLADGSTWSLVDMRTGEVLQLLDGPFFNECCGLETSVWSGNDGGVTWAVDHETIRIYYPELVSQPTVEVDLAP